MPAYVEILSGCIRLGPLTTRWLAPYERSCTFSSVDGVTAVVKGWVGTPTHQDRRDIQAALARVGLRLGKWQRAKHEQAATDPLDSHPGHA